MDCLCIYFYHIQIDNNNNSAKNSLGIELSELNSVLLLIKYKNRSLKGIELILSTYIRDNTNVFILDI